MWGSVGFKNRLCFSPQMTHYNKIYFCAHLCLVSQDTHFIRLFYLTVSIIHAKKWLHGKTIDCVIWMLLPMLLAGMNKPRNEWLQGDALLCGACLSMCLTHTHNCQRRGGERDTGPTTFRDWQQIACVLLSVNGSWSEHRGTRAKSHF